MILALGGLLEPNTRKGGEKSDALRAKRQVAENRRVIVNTTYTEVLGLPFDEARRQYLLDKYEPILSEIKKLRDLELKDTCPAIFFDPETAYKKAKGSDHER